MTTLDILARLVAFPTVSGSSNRALIGYVSGLLDGAGIPWELDESADGTRASLWATVGPAGGGGVILSGHTDVVPVEGQAWSRDPWRLHAAHGRLHGRGTVDMKGFVAAAVAAALRASGRRLAAPLHLALSYDEEIGCVGVRGLLDRLAAWAPRPLSCIVGEPTGLRVATGHKGKVALRATCTGRAAHSALAPDGLNALHLGADFLGVLRREGDRLRDGARDPAYDVPFGTVHAGRMAGGGALNVVPASCEIDWEVRHVAADDPREVLARVRAGAEAIVAPLRGRFPEAAIRIDEVNAYPGLDTDPGAPVVGLVRGLGGGATCKVAFGTEGGLFHERLGVPTVICGPGHMAQGHKADEWVAADQLAACDAMLDRLLDVLAA